jgi:O-antigen ligase
LAFDNTVGAGLQAPSIPQAPVAVASTESPLGQQWETDIRNPLRIIGFYIVAALVFVRFSNLHEVLYARLNTNTYMLYFLVPPALVLFFVTGGIRRVAQYRTTYYWLAFTAWMFLATAASSWRGGSAKLLFIYLRAELPMLLLIAGMVMTWAECKMIMKVIAFAGVFNLFAFSRALQVSMDRLQLDIIGGTLSNSNDMAGHLVMILPFFLYMVWGGRRNILVRLLFLAGIFYGLYLILGTASRGAFVALVVCSAYMFIRGRLTMKVMTLLIVPVAFIALISFLPERTWSRLRSFKAQSGVAYDEEAVASLEMRAYLLRTSLLYTIQHPLFGVGPGQFSTVEGFAQKARGFRGVWHETHIMFTQISSECGIPALVFYLGALISAYLALSRAYRASQNEPESSDTALFFLMVSFVGTCIVMSLLNTGYRFYFPALCALAATSASAAIRQFSQPNAPSTLLVTGPPPLERTAPPSPKSTAERSRSRLSRETMG